MTHAQLVAWILAAMTTKEPNAAWKASYATTAEAFAVVAEDSPLFGGDDGVKRTAALELAVTWFESTFAPDAVGDKTCVEYAWHGPVLGYAWGFPYYATGCARRGEARSFCLFQVGESNFAFLGVTRDQIMADRETCARAGVTMLRVSMEICKGRSSSDVLAHYAAGGATCPQEGAAVRDSRNRMGLAAQFFARPDAP